MICRIKKSYPSIQMLSKICFISDRIKSCRFQALMTISKSGDIFWRLQRTRMQSIRLYLKIPPHEILSAQNPVLKIPSNKIPSVSKSRQIKSRQSHYPIKQNPLGLKIPSISKSCCSKSLQSKNPVNLKILSISKSCRSQNPVDLKISSAQNTIGFNVDSFESTIMKINQTEKYHQ